MIGVYVPGTAWCAMSTRNWWPVIIAPSVVTPAGSLPTSPVVHGDLGIAVRTEDQIAVCVGRQQRRVMHVEVVQLDAQEFESVRLDLGPVGDGAVERAARRLSVEQAARGVGLLPSPMSWLTYSRRNT